MNGVTTKDGIIQKQYEIKFNPILFSGTPALMILIRDMTEKEMLKRYEIEEENKVRALASISHEFRTPLNGIIAMLDLLKEKVHDDLENNFIKPAKSSARLLLFLVNDILDLHQINQKKMNLFPVAFNLKAAIIDCFDLIAIQARQRGINLVLNYPKVIEEVICNDPNRTKQILNNLLSNALRFTYKGSITVDVTQPQKDRFYVRVLDTGIGIKKDKISNLLQEFGRVESSLSKSMNPQGVGLGLAITNKLAKLMCSSEKISGIRIDSNLGSGSTFAFFIDSKDIEKPSFEAEDDLRLTPFDKKNGLVKFTNKRTMFENEQSPIFKGSKRLFSTTSKSERNSCVGIELDTTNLNDSGKKLVDSPKILLADDNNFNQMAILNLLNILGHKDVLTAYNGEEALEKLQEHQQNLRIIFLDVEMPVMDGIECAKKMNQYMKSNKLEHIPIIGLTAHDSPEIHEDCLNAGMSAVIMKPVLKDDLERELRTRVDFS
jgi:CheY-like chemotaxis protein